MELRTSEIYEQFGANLDMYGNDADDPGGVPVQGPKQPRLPLTCLIPSWFSAGRWSFDYEANPFFRELLRSLSPGFFSVYWCGLS